MPLDITFTLSDSDLEHFQRIVDKSKSAVESHSEEEIETAARKLISDARAGELPNYIAERLGKLDVIINMAADEEWQLDDEERSRILGALVYFCNPEDLIPDTVPGLGYLDDAIYIEIIIRELKSEIGYYEEFSSFREKEEVRRKEQGLDSHVDREAWLADKRAALHTKMRKSRGLRKGWRLHW
jgi:uncharacterized membrane protein YkvA (DUF1232 family)